MTEGSKLSELQDLAGASHRGGVRHVTRPQPPLFAWSVNRILGLLRYADASKCHLSRPDFPDQRPGRRRTARMHVGRLRMSCLALAGPELYDRLGQQSRPSA